MKKWLVTLAVLLGSTVLVGRADIAYAASYLGTTTVTGNQSADSLTIYDFYGQVGDTFGVANGITAGPPFAVNVFTDTGDTGIITRSGVTCTALTPCTVALGTQSTTFVVVQLGTISIKGPAGNAIQFEISSPAAGGGGGPAPVLKGSFDPNGGECVWDGLKKTFTDDFFAIGYMYAPGAAECSRPGYVFADWVLKGSSPSTSAGLPVLVHEPDKVRRHFVAQSGSYVAKWNPAVTFNMAGGACTILGESRSGTYSVAVDAQGQTTPGTYLRVPAPEACSRVGYEFAGWFGDGARANSGEILLASSIVTAEWRPTIVIAGERTTVSRKPGICVSGRTTGVAAGDTVVPYVRFPGGDYTQGSARPVVGPDGSFEWCRKTGKKSYVYFTSSDGSVTSNRITIASA